MFTGSYSDQDLWSAVCNDDKGAFNALFDRYWTRLYNAAFRYLKDPEAAEEVVHDIFLNIWNRRKKLNINQFDHYLLKAVRYQVYNRMRIVKQPLVYMSDHIDEQLVFELNSGAYRIKEEELKQEMFIYIQQLPKRCQQIFQLSRMDNLSNQEIAAQLGVSKRTVENQLALALKHLKLFFKPTAFVLALMLVWWLS